MHKYWYVSKRFTYHGTSKSLRTSDLSQPTGFPALPTCPVHLHRTDISGRPISPDVRSPSDIQCTSTECLFADFRPHRTSGLRTTGAFRASAGCEVPYLVCAPGRCSSDRRPATRPDVRSNLWHRTSGTHRTSVSSCALSGSTVCFALTLYIAFSLPRDKVDHSL